MPAFRKLMGLNLFPVMLGVLMVMSTTIAMAATEEGIASYYADALNGNPTASGENYDKYALTAAHRTLPFGTMVRVINLDNGKHVSVRINDRGPHSKKRVIDVSGAAAKQLDLLDSGTAKVRLEIQD